MKESSKPAGAPAPSVGFVSLGCPKALVDSEQILTQLKAEGYAVSPTYEGADLVVVNTCGFIDSAVAESLDAIGEALHANGKVIVTGCLAPRRAAISSVMRIPACSRSPVRMQPPKSWRTCMRRCRSRTIRSSTSVPPQGIKLTPRHYAYLKISEGCNHRCTFCIIPSMRGDLVSRPLGEVMAEVERLLRAGVKELCVVSQDTSAYGVDIRCRTGFWQGRPVRRG